jgi:hypothetical protein
MARRVGTPRVAAQIRLSAAVSEKYAQAAAVDREGQ